MTVLRWSDSRFRSQYSWVHLQIFLNYTLLILELFLEIRWLVIFFYFHVGDRRLKLREIFNVGAADYAFHWSHTVRLSQCFCYVRVDCADIHVVYAWDVMRHFSRLTYLSVICCVLTIISSRLDIFTTENIRDGSRFAHTVHINLRCNWSIPFSVTVWTSKCEITIYTTGIFILILTLKYIYWRYRSRWLWLSSSPTRLLHFCLQSSNSRPSSMCEFLTVFIVHNLGQFVRYSLFINQVYHLWLKLL